LSILKKKTFSCIITKKVLNCMAKKSCINNKIAIGLVILIVISGFPLVSAGTPIAVSDQNSVRSAYIPVSVTYTLPSLSPGEEAKKQEVMREQDRINELLKANRTFWERKLSSQLLDLLGSDSYKQTGKISEQDMELMQTYYSVIPGTSTGDLFLVEIRVDKSASVDIVDPYIAKESGVIDQTIYCWVELNKLQDIASLDDVIQVRLVSKPRSSSDIDQTQTPKPSLGEKNPEHGESVPLSILTTIEAPVSVFVNASISPANASSSSYRSDAVTTPAPAASAPVAGVTIIAALMIVLLCMRREQRR
jgi:hypothetical protein